MESHICFVASQKKNVHEVIWSPALVLEDTAEREGGAGAPPQRSCNRTRQDAEVVNSSYYCL